MTARRLLTWGIIAALWALYLGASYYTGLYGKFGATDFDTYYRAAGQFLQGISPYAGIDGMVYLYPPLLGQLLMPLATLDFRTAWQIYFGFNVLVIVGTFALLSQFVPRRQAKLVWLFPLVFWQIFEGLYIGQITIILMGLMAAAWAAHKRGYPELAGALLALATWLKVYPVLLLIYFIWKRDWRVVRGGLVAGLLLMIPQFLISGFSIITDCLQTMIALFTNGQVALVSSNASLLGFAEQFFEGHPMVQPVLVSPVLHTAARLFLTVMVVGMMFYLTMPRTSSTPPPKDDRRFDLEYGLVVLTALLLSPTLFSAGMPPLLMTFYLLWRSQHGAKWITWACVLLGLVFFFFWIYIVGYSGNPPVSALQLSFGFYALMTLWGINVFLLRRRVEQPALALSY